MAIRRMMTVAAGAAAALGLAACGGSDAPEDTGGTTAAAATTEAADPTSAEPTTDPASAAPTTDPASAEPTEESAALADGVNPALPAPADLDTSYYVPLTPADKQVMLETCNAGDMLACNHLFVMAESGTPEYEAGSTCGGTQPALSGSCYEHQDVIEFGSSPMLDHFYDQCIAGYDYSCDVLYTWAAGDTEYMVAAETCGGRDPEGYNTATCQE